MEEIFIKFLGDISFPILLSIFLLIRLEKKLETLNTSLLDLKNLFVEKNK